MGGVDLVVYRMSKKGRSVKKKGLGKTDCKSDAAPARDRLLCCIGQLIGWLNLYRGQLASALAHYKQQEAGLTAWKDLTLCLITMHAPVTARDLALLQPLLDPQDSGIVDVQSLYSNLLSHQQKLSLTEAVSREAEVCSVCGLRLPQPQQDSNPRSSNSYVEVQLLLAPFASTAHHPCHMTYLLSTSTTILSLQHQLHSSLGTMATAVALFSEKSVQPSNRIPPHCTLMEIGVVGGEKTTPPKATLYYDYIPVSIQCPVLMTDHYYCDAPPQFN